MRVIRLLMASAPRLALFATAAGMFSGLANAAIIALVNQALTGERRTGFMLIAMYVTMVAIKLGANALSQVLLNRFAQRTISTLRRDLAGRILAAPLRKLEELGQPRLFAVLTDDVMALSEAFRTMPRLAANVAILFGCGIYLLWLSPLVVGGVMLFGVVGVQVYRLLLNRAVGAMRRARTSQDGILRHVRGLTEGTKELKLNAARRRDFISRILDGASTEFETHNLDSNAKLVLAFTWTQFVFLALIGLLLFLLPAVMDVSPRVLASYVVTTLYIMGPLTIVVDTIPVISRAGVALAKIDDIGLSLDEGAGESEASDVAPKTFEKIAARGICYSYVNEAQDRHFTLGPIDFELSPGEVTFVVGGNGSGKSTFGKLIAGLYVPEKGCIEVDGVPVDDAHRDAYRQHFSAVFSDFFLFDALLGFDDVNLDARARGYLADLRLEKKVSVSGGQLSTTALSQGQRKRLALLVAWLEDRPVYLFDEWAADQDPEFKAVFYQRLLPDLKRAGKAVFVISHDDRYFDVADRIFKLDEGQVTRIK